jgi:hypothetical protein
MCDTYRTTVQHAAGDVLLGWEVEAFSQQASIDLVDVAQVMPTLRRSRPRLYELQHLVLHVVIGRYGRGCFQQGGHVIEELSRSYLLDEMGAAVLNARVSELHHDQQ